MAQKKNKKCEQENKVSAAHQGKIASYLVIQRIKGIQFSLDIRNPKSIRGKFFSNFLQPEDYEEARKWARKQEPEELELYLNICDFSGFEDRRLILEGELKRKNLKREQSNAVFLQALPVLIKGAISWTIKFF